MSTNVTAVGALDFESEVLKAEKLVVVDFWAEWCGPCKMIAPLLEEIAGELTDKVKVVKVNVDNEQQLAQQYGIYNIPTLLFFKGGTVREQVVGTAAKKVLVEKINSNA
jgi:thioredoxin 1